MAYSVIKIELTIDTTDVELEVDVEWHMSEAGELTIDDFSACHYDKHYCRYQRVPMWLHKIIETNRILENHYLDSIEANYDE
tara:strand:- start:671 stop:916 length:246 start_codon:yes stop_codon:yes gene_type:complete